VSPSTKTCQKKYVRLRSLTSSIAWYGSGLVAAEYRRSATRVACWLKTQKFTPPA
jgi:hypothetical protein